MKIVSLITLVFTLGIATGNAAASRNVILVTLDGVRTQEMFDGIQTNVWQAQKEGEDITQTDLYKAYWAETGKERREKRWPLF